MNRRNLLKSCGIVLVGVVCMPLTSRLKFYKQDSSSFLEDYFKFNKINSKKLQHLLNNQLQYCRRVKVSYKKTLKILNNVILIYKDFSGLEKEHFVVMSFCDEAVYYKDSTGDSYKTNFEANPRLIGYNPSDSDVEFVQKYKDKLEFYYETSSFYGILIPILVQPEIKDNVIAHTADWIYTKEKIEYYKKHPDIQLTYEERE